MGKSNHHYFEDSQGLDIDYDQPHWQSTMDNSLTELL